MKDTTIKKNYMASLLGKADSTLVQGEYRAAMANVPGDLSNVYANEAANMEKLTTGISDAWGELNKEWNDRNKALTAKGDVVYENVFAGKYNNAMVAATDEAVQGISKRLKGQKRDKKGVEARKIEAEMSRFGKNTAKNAEIFTELADLSRNNGLIIEGSGVETQLLEAIFDDFNNNSNETKLTYKDGDFVYSFGGKSMTMSELNKSITRKDNAPPIAVQKVFNKVASDAVKQKRLATDSYKNDIKGRIKGFMANKSDKTNILHHKFEGLEYSFFDALGGKDLKLQEQIFETLRGLDTDVNNDGKIDTPEEKMSFLNTENVTAIQNEILNSPDSDEIIAGFLTDNLFQDAYNKGWFEKKTITDKASDKANGKGSGIELSYVKDSRLKAESIDKLISGKITLQGVRQIAIKLGPKASYRELKNGTIQILDAQNNPYIIDPKKPVEARAILYGLSGVMEEHRNKQLMGVALDSDDPSQRGYITFDPTK